MPNKKTKKAIQKKINLVEEQLKALDNWFLDVDMDIVSAKIYRREYLRLSSLKKKLAIRLNELLPEDFDSDSE